LGEAPAGQLPRACPRTKVGQREKWYLGEKSVKRRDPCGQKIPTVRVRLLRTKRSHHAGLGRGWCKRKTREGKLIVRRRVGSRWSRKNRDDLITVKARTATKETPLTNLPLEEKGEKKGLKAFGGKGFQRGILGRPRSKKCKNL